jgi:vacuolar-type H+-ATPase subunit E/Vma4
MSLENILQALEAEAERQVAEIEGAAQAEIECIRAQAQAEAETVRQKHVAAIQVPLRAEQARILNQAKLEALRVVKGTREALLSSALEAAARRLAALPTMETYASLLQRLLQEAADTLGIDSGLHLHVHSCDVELMGHIVQRMGLSAAVEGDLENEASSWACPGGLVATNSDERVRLVNTLDARLGKVANLYRSQIAEMLFGGQQES